LLKTQVLQKAGQAKH